MLLFNSSERIGIETVVKRDGERFIESSNKGIGVRNKCLAYNFLFRVQIKNFRLGMFRIHFFTGYWIYPDIKFHRILDNTG